MILSLLYTFIVILGPVDASSSSRFLSTCEAIAHTISSQSNVYYPGSENYVDDNHHWAPSSSSQSTCSVEPGTPHDVAAILKVLDRTTTPFAIKSGGHATDRNMSSTDGVLIAMKRFNTFDYDAHAKVVTLGVALTWDNVYTRLAPFKRSVVGGRAIGVGVGGFLLGGGYSFHTNRRGFGFDNIVSFELVLPSGKIVHVTKQSYPELFFGVRGGYNNFGIITKFTLKTYYQPSVYGGHIIYAGSQIPKAVEVFSSFVAKQSDPDANTFAFYGSVVNGTLPLIVSAFYNAPNAPSGHWDAFLNIPHTSSDLLTMSLSDRIAIESEGLVPSPGRGHFDTLRIVNYTVPLVHKILDIIAWHAGPGSWTKNSSVFTVLEPLFAPGINRPLDEAAFPHAKYNSPFNIGFYWPDAASDDLSRRVLRNATASIQAAVVEDGQDLEGLVLYPNYTLSDEPVESIYGANLPKLKKLRKKYDPKGLMLRASGYKLV